MEAAQSMCRQTALVGGTGSGKTWFAPIWVHQKLLAGQKGLAMGTGYQTHVEQVMMAELTRWLDDVAPGSYTLTRNPGILRLKANGAELCFASSENPLVWEGTLFDFAWMDEAGKMPRIAYDVVMRRTAYREGPLLITTVPYFEGWLKKEVYDEWIAGNPTIKWITCKTSDNKDYPVAEIERMRRTYRPDKFKIFVEGEWAKPAGMIYPDVLQPLVVEPFDIPDDWPIFAGHDYGISNPTTGVWGALSPDDCLYLIAEYEQAGMAIEDHVERWRGWGWLEGMKDAFGDPANPGIWLTTAKHGYPVLTADNKVAPGIDAVYTRLKTGRLKVFRGLNLWLDYRDRYVRRPDPKDPEAFLEEPLKPQPAEHLMDATRYLVMGLEKMTPASSTAVLATHRR